MGVGRLRLRSRFLPHHRAIEPDPEIIIDPGFAFVKFERARVVRARAAAFVSPTELFRNAAAAVLLTELNPGNMI